MEEHTLNVCLFLSCLAQHQLYVKVEKCEFHRDIITFLSYVISQGRVEMDQSKVKGKNFYCHFIRYYSLVAAPIILLLWCSPKKIH